MVDLVVWANRHGVSLAAVHELQHLMGEGFESPQPDYMTGYSEEAVTSRVRLEAPTKDCILWRNNVGAYLDDRGAMVRYGLANETKLMNKHVKSHDFVGIRKRLILPQDVGHFIGQFLSREIKRADWKFNMHDPHEAAQAKFGHIVTSFGGDAAFCTGVGSL